MIRLDSNSSDLSIVKKIATVTNVNGNSLASTTIALLGGFSLSNYCPIMGTIIYRTGTYTLGIAKVVSGASDLTGLIVLNGLSSTAPVIFSISTVGGLLDTTGNLGITIATVNGTAATFDIAIYGIKYA